MYDNVDGIADAFADYFAKMGEYFNDNELLLGYDLFNEPWAGMALYKPWLMIPSIADSSNLMGLYDRISEKLRKTDPNHILYMETVTWDDIIPAGFSHPPGGD